LVLLKTIVKRIVREFPLLQEDIRNFLDSSPNVGISTLIVRSAMRNLSIVSAFRPGNKETQTPALTSPPRFARRGSQAIMGRRPPVHGLKPVAIDTGRKKE
jgi:hypothetical protein